MDLKSEKKEEKQCFFAIFSIRCIFIDLILITVQKMINITLFWALSTII